ncbi:hypothetical protein LCGC14_0641340 [marine sediment metagenome]|uniref:Uncharacterized protein n=1 Tax=marine sediment metagenome TaxID=412755 RepID=A0A0F9R455_9ZZZZ|nr:hypothetical protein [archaeon]HEC36781.1 hypothetical protein [bacterium]
MAKDKIIIYLMRKVEELGVAFIVQMKETNAETMEMTQELVSKKIKDKYKITVSVSKIKPK